jgi:D-glycero-D-manno-heptose 1,7-bisphosphate phosphatase
MKTVIVDRDTVIQAPSPAPSGTAADFQILPGSVEALTRLHQAGCRVILVDGQTGAGTTDLDLLFGLHDRIQQAVAELGGRVDAVAFSTPAQDEAPRTLADVLVDLARRLQAPLDGVPFVSSATTALQAAGAAGATPVHVGDGAQASAGIATYADLGSFAKAWLASA